MPVHAPSRDVPGGDEKFDAMYAAGRFWMPMLPPCLAGRLVRGLRMEKRLSRIADTGGRWLAPMMEAIAAHAQAGRSDLRVDGIGPAI